jgi:hypothetical protein
MNKPFSHLGLWAPFLEVRDSSRARPIKWRTEEYTLGLNQSDGGLGNILWGSTNQMADWGIYSRPWPIRRRLRECIPGFNQSGGGLGNILHSTNQVADWKVRPGSWPIRWWAEDFCVSSGSMWKDKESLCVWTETVRIDRTQVISR